jgi:hypothetical protein
MVVKRSAFTVHHFAALAASAWFLAMCGNCMFSAANPSLLTTTVHQKQQSRVPLVGEYPILLPLKFAPMDKRNHLLAEVRNQLNWSDLSFATIDKMEVSDLIVPEESTFTNGIMTITSVIRFLSMSCIVLACGALGYIFSNSFIALWILSLQLVIVVIRLVDNIPGFWEGLLYTLLGMTMNVAHKHNSVFFGFLVMFAAIGLFASSAYLREIPRNSDSHGLLNYAIACMFIGTLIFDSTHFGVVFAALLSSRVGLLTYANGTGGFIFGFAKQYLMVQCLLSSFINIIVLIIMRSVFDVKDSPFEPGLAFFGGFGSLLATLIMSSRFYSKALGEYLWFNTFFIFLVFLVLMPLGLVYQMACVTPVAGGFLGFWVLEKATEVPVFHSSATAAWIGMAIVSFVVYQLALFVHEHPSWFVETTNRLLLNLLALQNQ